MQLHADLSGDVAEFGTACSRFWSEGRSDVITANLMMVLETNTEVFVHILHQG